MFFMADVAMILELFAFCFSFVLLHQARKEGSGLIRSAGIILLIGSIFLSACTISSVNRKRDFLEKRLEMKMDGMKKDGKDSE